MMTPSRLILVCVLVAAVGSISGVVATTLTQNALSEYVLELVTQTPVTSSQEPSLSSPVLQGRAEQQAFLQGLSKQTAFVVERPQGVLGVRPKDTIGHAAVLTSDGWMYTRSTQGIVIGMDVVLGSAVYSIDEVRRDPRTEGFFFHVEAQGLPVMTLGSLFDVVVGTPVIMTRPFDGWIARRVSRVERVVGLADDTLTRTLEIDPAPEQAGGLVLSEQGQLLGVLDPVTDNVLSVELIRASLQQLLNGSAIEPVRLGVTTIDLAHTYGLSETLTRGFDRGALVHGRGAIVSLGAADKAGLQVGDIILSVDDERLDQDRSLAERLHSKQAGGPVRLSVDRAGEMTELIAVLDPSS